MQCQIYNLQINKHFKFKKVSTAVDKVVDTSNIAKKLYTANKQIVDKFFNCLKFLPSDYIKFEVHLYKCLIFHLD